MVSSFRTIWAKKWVKALFIILAFFILLAIFHKSILRSAGNYLIYEDEIQQSEIIFVLSGNSYDRGHKAIELLEAGYADQIICTGENIHPVVKALGMEFSEGQMTLDLIEREGVEMVSLLESGTSTFEESEVILEFCQTEGIGSIILVSDLFHTRRMKRVFKKKFRKAGIEVCIQGASNSEYDEKNWWGNEAGLISLNNEYVKLIYYRLKY